MKKYDDRDFYRCPKCTCGHLGLRVVEVEGEFMLETVCGHSPLGQRFETRKEALDRLRRSRFYQIDECGYRMSRYT